VELTVKYNTILGLSVVIPDVMKVYVLGYNAVQTVESETDVS
jgi:hypothetical protein